MLKFAKKRGKAGALIAGLWTVTLFAVTIGVLSLLIGKVSATDTSYVYLAVNAVNTDKGSGDEIDDSSQKQEPAYQATLQKVMNRVFSELESIEKEKGLSPEEKQQKAKDFIKIVRWGPEKKDYFWINDLQGKMLMDPYIPDLAGKDLMNFKDQNGKEVFAEIIKICREKEQGYVDYFWPRYEGKKPVQKVSLVRLFKPWGWAIGTGVYSDTIEAYEIPEVMLYIPAGTGLLPLEGRASSI
ncbi:MAG: cache domain-containing protein [Desulfonauticus sp.]|nr:cache domain-containing protein [Desulfonauticus sp.]